LIEQDESSNLHLGNTTHHFRWLQLTMVIRKLLITSLSSSIGLTAQRFPSLNSDTKPTLILG